MILQEITVGKQTKKNEDPKVTPDSNNHLIFEKAFNNLGEKYRPFSIALVNFYMEKNENKFSSFSTFVFFI